MTHHRTPTVFAAAAVLLASCDGAEHLPRDDDERHGERHAEPHVQPQDATPLDPQRFLPPLSGYETDDDVETGEIQASLDHGPVPYVDIRRRLILDPQGFAMGDITVVTFQPEHDGPERFLRHWYGDATRTPVEVGGVEMLRIPTQAYDALAWAGPEFVVTFGRSQAVTHEWLEDLARATVSAVPGQGL